MLLLRWLPLCLLLVIAASISKADADTFPFVPFSAEYSGEAKGISSDNLGSRKLIELDNGRYKIEYQAEVLVYSLEETSMFEWDNGTPKPLQYKSSRGAAFSKRKSNMDFDWPNKTIRYDHKGKKGTLPLTEGTQDPLTGIMLVASELLSDKKEVSFRQAVGKKFSDRQFVLKGKVDIETNMGNVTTFKVERLHDDPERRTIIWLHSEYPYIPVKVQQYDDGDLFLLEINSFKLTGQN